MCLCDSLYKWYGTYFSLNGPIRCVLHWLNFNQLNPCLSCLEIFCYYGEMFFRLVRTEGHGKNSESTRGIELQPLGFRALKSYHWATKTLWRVGAFIFRRFKCETCPLLLCHLIKAIDLKSSHSNNFFLGGEGFATNSPLNKVGNF